MRQGGTFIKSIKKELHIPFISSNIVYEQNSEYFVEPYIIKEFFPEPNTSIKVAILGVCPERKAFFSSRLGEPMLKSLNPEKAIEKIVPELKGKCNIIILLSHLGFELTKQLAQKMNEIDIIISGGDQKTSSGIALPNHKIIASAGLEGKNLGSIEISNINSTIKMLKHELIPLTDKIENDRELLKLTKEYDSKELLLTKNK